MRVIINADDFGVNATVNTEIERCIREGLITSTTIMAAGDGFEEAIEISKLYPQISFGVHLTLDELSSQTKSPVLHQYGLTDEHGEFIKGAVFKVDEWTKELRDAVFNELGAQIEKVINAGITPSHFDGHHHCHTISALHEVLERLTKKYSVKKVRVPLDFRTMDMRIHHINPAAIKRTGTKASVSSKASKMHSMRSTILCIIRSYRNDRFFKSRFKTADYCCSVATFKKNEAYMLQAMRNKTIELMCHPGHPNYYEETAMLSSLPTSMTKISYNRL